MRTKSIAILFGILVVAFSPLLADDEGELAVSQSELSRQDSIRHQRQQERIRQDQRNYEIRQQQLQEQNADWQRRQQQQTQSQPNSAQQTDALLQQGKILLSEEDARLAHNPLEED